MPKNAEYAPVPKLDFEPYDSSSELSTLDLPAQKTLKERIKHSAVWLIHAVLFLINVTLLYRAYSGHCSIETCVRETSWWSPAISSIATDYEDVRYAGLLDLQSVWRGEPTAELDNAWDAVTWHIPEIPVSLNDAIRSGITLDPQTLVRFPPQYGGQIYATVEWTHHLHCLNVIRKSIRMDYYRHTEVGLNGTAAQVTNHLDHCVDMIRQHIMCTADQGLVFSHWVEGHDHRHVDFNTQHKCRNFQKAVDWAIAHGKQPDMSELVRHPGAKDLPDYPENLTRHSGGYKGSIYYQT